MDPDPANRFFEIMYTLLWNMCYYWNLWLRICTICEMWNIQQNVSQNVSWKYQHSKISQNISRHMFQNKCHQNNPKIFYENILRTVSQKIYHISHKISCLFLNILVGHISRILHVCHRFRFYHIFHHIYHVFTFSKYSQKCFVKYCPLISVLQKFLFAASYARWADSHCYNGSLLPV